MDSTEVLAVARRILSTQTLGFLATVGKSSPSIRMVGALVDQLQVRRDAGPPVQMELNHIPSLSR